MNYFIVKVRYEKTGESGEQSKALEQYVVDAMSFTEAEAKIIKYITPFVSAELEIDDISKYKIAESVLLAGDKYYKCKLDFITLDEKSGKEKKTPFVMLIQANDIEEARGTIVSEMNKTTIDYTLSKLEETKIMDVVA